MKLIEVNSRLNDILEKGYTIGITLEDFRNIQKIMNDSHIAYYASTDTSWYKTLEKYHNLKNILFSEGLLDRFSKENMEYIKVNSPLLPLVLTNTNQSRIKIRSGNNYMFYCHFANPTKNPTMSLSDSKNVLRCFDCGASYNPIGYLENYENLPFAEVMELLSSIYLYTDNISSKKIYLVDKYRKSLLSKKYEELLKQGYNRLLERGEDEDSLSKIYDKKYALIERVRNGEYDSNFRYQEPPKIIKLNKMTS